MPKRLLITAGPTHEPLDPVRYLANRSSGKLGLAFAQAGRDAGWDVTLLLGPVDASSPPGVQTHRFTTAVELEALLRDHFPRCDALIMAAAVADFRPVRYDKTKIPRGSDCMLHLTPTPDLVAACCASKRHDQFVLGFALEESKHLAKRATQKLARKSLNAIVANPIETMGSDTIDATLITLDGSTSPGPMSKPDFAKWLIEWVSQTTK